MSDLSEVRPVGVAGRSLSVLFDTDDPAATLPSADEPGCFGDLNLDRLVASVLEGLEEYDLSGVFHVPLRSVGAVCYRHEVFADLEDLATARCLSAFSQQMRTMRDRLGQSDRFRYPVQRQVRFLDAAQTYVQAVRDLAAGLADLDLTARALVSFRSALEDYITGAEFTALAEESQQVADLLGCVRYRVHILGDRIHVSDCADEEDYAADVTATFERFGQGPVRSHLSSLSATREMNHIEAKIAELVARLQPGPFQALGTYVDRHREFSAPMVTRFDREIQFYRAYVAFADRLRGAGLSVCYPEMAEAPAGVEAEDAFDAALADALVREDRSVVTNAFSLSGSERVLVVTGPNQGGKTTFARMLGQVHYLASLGLPVPGRRARLFLPDRVFTHFERGENLDDLTGRLEDDLVRVREILAAATPASLLVINEIFASTSLEDAVFLGRRILERVDALGCACVWVTFLDELTRAAQSAVSMVATVDPDDPTTRTLQVARRPADGLAYAGAIADKHGLARDGVRERVLR